MFPDFIKNQAVGSIQMMMQQEGKKLSQKKHNSEEEGSKTVEQIKTNDYW